MFRDPAKRQKLKNILIGISIVLAIIFGGVFLYGLIEVRPQNISKASELGQYYEFNSTSLPSNNAVLDSAGAQNIPSDDNVKDSKILGALEEQKQKPVVRPHISILVTNLGLNPLSTELSLSLPKEVGLGFLPYTTSLKPLFNKARENGHEIFIYLPFETAKYPDDSPGQMPLLLDSSDEENISNMNNLLNSYDGYVGVYGSVHEIFTNNSNKMGAILGEIASRKLKLFVNNKVRHDGEMADVVISSTILIDAEPTVSAIKKQLDALVELAKAGKPAIGCADSYPVTIYTLKAWLPTLKSLGVEIVPITSMTYKGVAQ